METKFLRFASNIILALLVTAVCQGAIETLKTFEPATSQQISPTSTELKILILRAEAHVKTGTESLRRGERTNAKKEFSQAVDVILHSGFDTKISSPFQSYYRMLVDRVAKLESIPQDQWSAPLYDDEGKPHFIDTEVEFSAGETNSLKQTLEKLRIESGGNPLIHQYVNFYALRGRASLTGGLQRSLAYEGIFRRILDEEGIPQELFWMVQALTDWNVYAKSRSNAAGLWQLPTDVAQGYGLSQTPWLDERYNPEKATRTAARYLKDLNKRYNGDWLLAISGYFSGALNTDRAISRAGAANLWRIFPYLIPENRSLILQTLATIHIGSNKELYGFVEEHPISSGYETVNVGPATDLAVISKTASVDLNILRRLNAELRTQFTPPGESYQLRIPEGTGRALLGSRLLLNTAAQRSIGRGPIDQKVGLSVSNGRVVLPTLQPKCTSTPENGPNLLNLQLGEQPRAILGKMQKELALDETTRDEIIKNLDSLDPRTTARLTLSRLTDNTKEYKDNILLNLAANVNIFVPQNHWPITFHRFDQCVFVFREGRMVSEIVQFNRDSRWQDVDDLTLAVSEDLRLTGQWQLGEEACIVRTLPCVGFVLSTSFELDRTMGEYRARVIITDIDNATKN